MVARNTKCVCEKDAIISSIVGRLEQGEERFEGFAEDIGSIKSWIGINGEPKADNDKNTVLGRLRRLERTRWTLAVILVVTILLGCMFGPYIAWDKVEKTTGIEINEQAVEVIIQRTIKAADVARGGR